MRGRPVLCVRPGLGPGCGVHPSGGVSLPPTLASGVGRPVSRSTTQRGRRRFAHDSTGPRGLVCAWRCPVVCGALMVAVHACRRRRGLVIAGIVAVRRSARVGIRRMTRPLVRCRARAPGGPRSAARGSPSTAAAADPRARSGHRKCGGGGSWSWMWSARVGRPGLVSLPAGLALLIRSRRPVVRHLEADLSSIRLVWSSTASRSGYRDRVRSSRRQCGGTRCGGRRGRWVGALVSLQLGRSGDPGWPAGVGPVLAQRILDRRSEHGRFTSVDELGEGPASATS